MTPSPRMMCSLLTLIISCYAAQSQENLPRLGYAFPAGGRQGTSFQITVGGQSINDIGRVTFSGAGVEARLVEGIKPMTESDVRTMRDRLTQLAKNQKEHRHPPRDGAGQAPF